MKCRNFLVGVTTALRLQNISLLAVMLLMVTAPAIAQNTTPTSTPEPERRRVTVIVDSAFVRALPTFDADPVGSLFEDEQLEVIGRNLDGRWFEVVRPFRTNSLGWVNERVLDYEFKPEFLSLTDFTTNVFGESPLKSAPPLAVFINEEVILRTLPDVQRGDQIWIIPAEVVVPIFARYRQGEWLQVSYFGNEGWIIAFTVRDRPEIESLPNITGLLPGDDVELSAEIIPPEIQLAQLNRLRDFATPRVDVASNLANFWWLVSRGEILPCSPPPSVNEYRYTGRDVQELPEIDRYVPRMNEGVQALNRSVDVLNNCGVVSAEDVIGARADAINARIIFNNTLVQLDNLERNVIR